MNDISDIPGFYKILKNELRDSEYELEYKLKLGQSELVEIIKGLKDKIIPNMELEQTINMINNGNDTNIMTVVYKHGSKQHIEYIKKNKLMNVNFKFLPFLKMTLSRESKSKPSPTYDMARIKNRLSVPFDGVRLDITQTITINNDQKSTKQFASDVKNEGMIMFHSTQNLSGAKLFDEFVRCCTDRFVEFEMEILDTKDLQISDIVRDRFPTIAEKIIMGSMLWEIKEICGFTNSESLKRMLPPAKTLSKTIYKDKFPPIGCHITRKIDGERALLVKTMAGEHILSSKYSGEGVMTGIMYALDCEYVDGCIVPFDMIINKGSSVCDLQYEERLVLMKNSFSEFNSKIHPKRIEKITSENMESIFKRVSEEKIEFPDDGFMLIEGNESYQKTKSWKIKEDNTIDFLAIPHKGAVYLFNGEHVRLLEKMGIKKIPEYKDLFDELTRYIPIQFCPADSPDKYLWNPPKSVMKEIEDSLKMIPGIKVPATFVELSPPDMKFVGIRYDRFNVREYYGNSFFSVAQFNWFVSQDPINIRDMATPPQSYFNVKKDTRYASQIYALSMVKDMEIEHLAESSDNKIVCVLAAGNGQDTHRFIKYGFKKSINVDNDRIALSILYDRRLRSVMNKDVLGNMQHETITHYSDLSRSSKEIWNGMEKYLSPNPDTCVCNLAIHYFMKDHASMIEFAMLVDKILSAKGRFMYTCFDGKKIFDLLKDGTWTDMDGSTVPKYILEKRYKVTKFVPGLKIGVKLPFSNELYEEYLTDVEGLNAIFTKMGYKVEIRFNMDEYVEAILKKSKSLKLTESDIRYLSFYIVVVVSKK